MTPDSFTYNGVNMFEHFKIKILTYDLLLAPRRQQKLVIPGRSGAYDFDGDEHDERPLRMLMEVDGLITPAQFDSLKYTLSRKGRIILWDKPDRYFVGRLYDPVEVIDHFRHMRREFEATFMCEPYAYALAPTVVAAAQAIMPIDYAGTRKTPTRITIRNTGSTPMQGVAITAREIV